MFHRCNHFARLSAARAVSRLPNPFGGQDAAAPSCIDLRRRLGCSPPCGTGARPFP
ncbi:Myo-inositol 2-dehydrogenase 1 [Ralstonia solanacearum]|nr:Myo-inositol 2-dehydrogenase 1 [Ralstonia solanacearum]